MRLAVEDAPKPAPEHGPVGAPFTQVHRVVRRTLETIQDVVIIVLTALLTLIMLQALWRLVQLSMVEHAPPANLLSHIVYVLILTELYRTLIFYLREHRVSVALMLEVAIVSILQGLILSGAQGHQWRDVVGNSVLLVVLGGLLALDRWFQRMGDAAGHTSAH